MLKWEWEIPADSDQFRPSSTKKVRIENGGKSGGARPSRSPCGASRAALLEKDVFGGTPNTARETHALPRPVASLLAFPLNSAYFRVTLLPLLPSVACLQMAQKQLATPVTLATFGAQTA